jgi:hypothetical protein
VTRKPKPQRLSRLGNPFPAGLKPAEVPESIMGGLDVEAAWSKETYDPGEPEDYLHEQPAPGWPRLDLYPAKRRPHQTDEQYAICRSGFERHTNTHAVWLGLCQLLCSKLGNHRTCREGVCRRNGACRGIRDQRRYSLPLLIYPPCVPLDREIMETLRMEIVAEVKRVMAEAPTQPVARPAKTA